MNSHCSSLLLVLGIYVLLVAGQTPFVLNKNGVFESSGTTTVNIWRDNYEEGHQGGLVIIQQGERTVSNGDLRLDRTPTQWTELPGTGSLKVDTTTNTASLSHCRFSRSGHTYNITVHAEPTGTAVTVQIDLISPKQWPAVWFNFELMPAMFFGKSYVASASGSVVKNGVFPRQCGLYSTGELPVLAAGLTRVVVAPEDQMHSIAFEVLTPGAKFELLDDRIVNQDGWFLVSAPIPASGSIVFRVTPSVVPSWIRTPSLLISQVGYHTHQQIKRCVVELDKRVTTLEIASLIQIHENGKEEVIVQQKPEMWGFWVAFNYAIFDFSSVTAHGIYIAQYGNVRTAPFLIADDVYRGDALDQTLSTYFPVQMCHVSVRDVYRVWHGACHMEDALQAPPNTRHFDGYSQGSKTETPYKGNEHVPHLNRGGWHDAGDDDIAGGSHATAVLNLALAEEEFHPALDAFAYNEEDHEVVLHKADGVRDILTQIAYGAEALLGGFRASDHAFCGIASRDLQQYTHLGDRVTYTDGYIYSPDMLPNETDGKYSGKLDDRWVFTNRDTALEYWVASALTAAYRALRTDPATAELAEECLKTSEKAFAYEQSHPSVNYFCAYNPGNIPAQMFSAAVELFLATGDSKYAQVLIDNAKLVATNEKTLAWRAARVLGKLGSTEFDNTVRAAIKQYSTSLAAEIKKTPFNISWVLMTWGADFNALNVGQAVYYLRQVAPEQFPLDPLFGAVNYCLGMHPANGMSLVSGVGTESLTHVYGFNRADWSYIPGAVEGGPTIINPEHFELRTDYPFIWEQTENIITTSSAYIFGVLAADKVLSS